MRVLLLHASPSINTTQKFNPNGFAAAVGFPWWFFFAGVLVFGAEAVLGLTAVTFLAGCALLFVAPPVVGFLLKAPGFGAVDFVGAADFLFGPAPEVTGVFFAPSGLVDVGGAVMALRAGAPSIFF